MLKRDYRDLVVLCALLSLFFLPGWLTGEVFGTFDLGHLTIPLEDVFARYQARGEIPVWAPEFQGGWPLMANGLQSFWYPPHVLLRAIVPGVWVANISLLLHLWLAAVGMWMLLRRHVFAHVVAFIGAFIFAGGGYFVGRITLPHLLFPVAWMPWVLIATLAAWRRPTITNILLLAVVGALQIFAGHTQVIFYTAMLLTVVVAVLLWERQQPWPYRLLALLVAAGLVWLLTAVQLWPTQELIPQSRRAEALQGREAFDVSYPRQHLLTWLVPTAFGTQDDYRGAKNEPELMAFFGLVGLVAGLVGSLSRRTRRTTIGRAALLWIVVGFVMAGGEYSPIYRYLTTLPTYISQLANPGRAIVLVHLGWVVLVAFGLEALLQVPRRQRLGRMAMALMTILALGAWVRWGVPSQLLPLVDHHLRLALPTLFGVTILLAVTLALPWYLAGFRAVLLVAIVVGELVATGIGLNARTAMAAWRSPPRLARQLVIPSDAPRIFSHDTITPFSVDDFQLEVGPLLNRAAEFRQGFVAQRNHLERVELDLTWNGPRSYPGEVTLQLFSAAGEALRSVTVNSDVIKAGEGVSFAFAPLPDSAGQAYTLGLQSSHQGRQAPRLMVAINTGSVDYNPTGELAQCAASCRLFRNPQETASTDLSFRLYYPDTPVLADRELLEPLFGESFGYQMIRGHLTLQFARVAQYLYELGERGDYDDTKIVGRRALLDRFSVGTLVASYEEHRFLVGVPGLTRVATVPVGNRYIHAYHNEQAYPRLSLAKGVVVRRDGTTARHALIEGEVAPGHVVVENITPPPDLSADTGASARLVVDQSRHAVIEVSTRSPQLLVLRDVHEAGWQAALDGRPVPIYYTDVLFRGVLVPPGKHQVTFTYDPPTWRRAARTSGLSWLLLAVALVVANALRYRQSVVKVARP